MATTSSALQALYEDVVADLIPYFDNAVLLPNSQLIVNTQSLVGAVGNTVKIPVHDAWGAGSTVGEGNAIISAATSDFTATNVPLTISKRGAGTYVNEEALEDGGLDMVRSAVLRQLSGSIAQATDVAGFNVMASGAEGALTDLADVDIANDGAANTALAGADVALVFSPEAGAYAVKREPSVAMDRDVDRDRYEMVATVRNGFARVRSNFIRAIASSDAIGETDANLRCSLEFVSTAVANLRAQNAPTDGAGFYVAVVTPAQELHIARELNGIGGLSTGAIGDLSMVGNQALIDGMIGQAIGCRFVRSNNLPSGLTSV
jgi:hypothetical protein